MPVLTAQETDFPRWYQDVVAKAELAENGPVPGTMVIRPWGYAIWELLQAEMDRRIKAAGAENVYLPLLIPESHLRREAEHVEGFSPELAVVTHAGGHELDEPAVVRPTSETVFGEFLARWIQSYRDLPMRLNQWANVVRWELRPRLFLRPREFLWQEGHTAHATREDAAAYARRIHLDVYRSVFEEVLAIPVLTGLKTETERFAGATATLTCEGMMRDGKALQLATSHELGQNFARAFEMVYTARDGSLRHCWTTSWGSSIRMVGGLIMNHGDDAGLRLPPAVAPAEVLVIAVKDDSEVLSAVDRLECELAARGLRVRVDRQTETGFGRRLTNWELKGVPVRLEVGPRELAEGAVTLARRTTGERETVTLGAAVAAAASAAGEAHGALLAEARERLESRTIETTSLEDAIEAARTGFARIEWERCGAEGERRAGGSGVSVRCLMRADGTIPDDPDERDLVAVLARAY